MNKLYIQNKNTEEVVGRAKTVMVSNEGPAVITSIIVSTIEYKESVRLVFTGLVNVEEKLKQHLNDMILPLVDEITIGLGLKLQSYDISVVNIGAVSSSDSEFTIKGYSADVPIFLAILSSSLQLPIKQNTVFTGHISSKKGDISQVKGLIEKSEAAQREEGISEFVYPNLNKERSLKVLKPKEYEKTIAAIRGCRGKIILTDVNNIEELIKKTISDQAIVFGSLYSQYYETNHTEIGNESHTIVKYLKENNEKRFWNSIEKNLLLKEVEKTKSLLKMHLNFNISANKYPKQFGINLRNLILSLPLTNKKAKGLFPIIPKDIYVKLIQNAVESDYDDIVYLHELTFKQRIPLKEKSEVDETKIKDKINHEIIEYLLERLNPYYIDEHILTSFDEARSNYLLDEISVKSYEDLIESIAKFYLHLLRYNNSKKIQISNENLVITALDILKKTYYKNDEYERAISNGLNGYNGGLRKIFDNITEYLKQTEKEKYINSTINELINPLDYETKKLIVKEILTKESDKLFIEKEKLIPAKFVNDYIEIIKQYANSNNKLQEIFARL